MEIDEFFKLNDLKGKKKRKQWYFIWKLWLKNWINWKEPFGLNGSSLIDWIGEREQFHIFKIQNHHTHDQFCSQYHGIFCYLLFLIYVGATTIYILLANNSKIFVINFLIKSFSFLHGVFVHNFLNNHSKLKIFKIAFKKKKKNRTT